MKTEPIEDSGKLLARLPFSIQLVRDNADWDAVIQVRKAAYGRHLPALAEKMETREEGDFAPDTQVLVAYSRRDHTPIGTMRMHRNTDRALPLEQSVPLPLNLTKASLIEATRFAINSTEFGPALTTTLFKSFYVYAMHHGVDYMVITARRPLDRMYERLLFNDVHPGAGYVPMKHVGNVPHRVLYFSVKNAQSNWLAAAHPLYQFVFQTDHPDICVTEPVDAARAA